MARPIAREAAMQLVFEQLFGGDATAQTLVDLIDYNPNEKDSTYIDTVVGGVKEHADELDSEISACLRGMDAGAPVPRGSGDYASGCV